MKNNEPTIDDIADTKFTKGNRAAETTGATTFLRRGVDSLNDEMSAMHVEFRDSAYAEQGGRSEVTTLKAAYIERLAQLNTLANLFAADLEKRGILSPRGRVRSSVELYLKTVDRFDKLARVIGLDKKPKAVPSLNDYVNTFDGVEP